MMVKRILNMAPNNFISLRSLRHCDAYINVESTHMNPTNQNAVNYANLITSSILYELF